MVNRGYVSLGLELHRAAMAAKVSIEAIPEYIGIDEEVCLIDAASAEANELAHQILALPAQSRRASRTKDLAQAWLDGTYWRQVA